MIDPPPYSSATLEREGIRPQMIMAIIITHCHADHDAGAFQKIMTGARVAIITTPTIYQSFIRKYSALSGLRPTLLRHSHRHRPAIVGQPLKFQGAVFHFAYTLHTIPCLSFKVEWRGRSIVFTGDHLNSPPVIDSLEEKVSFGAWFMSTIEFCSLIFVPTGHLNQGTRGRPPTPANPRV
jgi:glyoxylase-like metal-dependent hydrolase (beta-lactamase superfamily II)